MIVTLVPNELITESEDWISVGGSIPAALADDSDSTYVESLPENAEEFRVGFTTYAIPAYAQARRMILKVRAYHQHPTQVFTFDTVDLWMWWGPRGRHRDFRTTVFPGRTVATLEGNEHDDANPRSNSGRFWTQDDVDTITVGYSLADETFSNRFRITKAFIDLEINFAPTIGSVGGVTDPETSTSRPTITWAYSDAEGDPQEQFRLRVFTQAQYSAPGFDPSTSIAFWDSGYLMWANNSWQIGKFLRNGTRYRAYPIVSDAGSFGRFSPYGPYAEWTQQIPEPATPIIVGITPEQTPSPRVRIQILAGISTTTTTSFLVERSEDGVNYEQVLEIENDGSDGLDYTAPRNVPIHYRIRAQHYDGANRLSWSGYTAPVTITLAYDSKAWLKSTTDPSLNVSVCLSTTELESSSLQSQGFIYALGRRYPQVGLRTIYRDTFEELPLAFLTDVEWEAFERLRDRQEILLLQTPYGDTLKEQWFLRIGTQEITFVTMPIAPNQIRLISLSAYEVDPPPQTNVVDSDLSADAGGGYQSDYGDY